MTCLNLVNPTIWEMAWCSMTMATGSELLAVILLFCVFLYGIHTFKLPYQVFLPIGIMLLFVFAGAGASPLGGLKIFTDLMWIAIIMVGAIVALFFWGLKKG